MVVLSPFSHVLRISVVVFFLSILQSSVSIPTCDVTGCDPGSCCSDDGSCVTTEGISCENYACGGGEECYLTNTCPPERMCRPFPNCSTILCIEETTCINNECIPITCKDTTCKPEEVCYIKPGNSTYPTTAACRPRRTCAEVRCPKGTRCLNGECVPCEGHN
ncbi:keratin-associated protein 5-1-like [Homalodisca vitripennis]|uniref:keratin-associated protein 5-1-like n=1 Tax=Homalodisca vitripennis TaxID=197043 RepID=UPI001EEAB781|nr:keratin-associated protein 5-1-like [Homalodisca vitripennis]